MSSTLQYPPICFVSSTVSASHSFLLFLSLWLDFCIEHSVSYRDIRIATSIFSPFFPITLRTPLFLCSLALHCPRLDCNGQNHQRHNEGREAQSHRKGKHSIQLIKLHGFDHLAGLFNVRRAAIRGLRGLIYT